MGGLHRSSYGPTALLASHSERVARYQAYLSTGHRIASAYRDRGVPTCGLVYLLAPYAMSVPDIA
eukprot:444579-Rhodomonas_salina.1